MKNPTLRLVSFASPLLALIAALTMGACGDDGDGTPETSAEGGSSGGKKGSGGKSSEDGSGGSGSGGESTETDGGSGGSEQGSGGSSAGGSSSGGATPGSGGTAPTGDATYTVTPIPPPDGMKAGMPLALNDSEHVLFAAAESFTSFDRMYVYYGAESTLVPLGDTLKVSINGLNAYGCLTNDDTAAFNAQLSGSQQAVWFDGTETTAIEWDAAVSPASMVVRTCNNDGVVAATTATGTAVRTWKKGEAAFDPIGDTAFGVFPIAVDSDGLLVTPAGTFDGNTFTKWADDGFQASKGIGPDFLVAGVVVGGVGTGTATVEGAYLEKGDTTATKLPLPEGAPAGIVTPLAMGENGDIIVRVDDGKKAKRFWRFRDGAYTEIVVDGGYEVAGIIDVNADGVILASGSTPDGNTAMGLLLTP